MPLRAMQVLVSLAAAALAHGDAVQPSAERCAHEDGSGTCIAPLPGAAPADAAPAAAETVLIQRSWKPQQQPEIRLSDFEADAGWEADATDYDCNGDGIRDCGMWNYQMGMCMNRAYCESRFKVGDWSLDRSCRCRRCNDPALAKTAFGDGQLMRPTPAVFDALAWGTFRVWADHLNTCAPWVMPRTDEDLQRALSYARERGYKVRISGAGHSAGGLVTDGEDTSAFVLSLGEYRTSGEWEFGLRDMPDGSKRATVNAGWTQAHLYEKVRPLGFFLPAQTAGYFFALGGIVANSVHGGAYNEGFVHSYVTRLRVMSFDGSIRIIDDEAEIKFWRCSFGLLGIILGIEFQLEQRSHLQMYTVAKKMPAWNAEEFWRFIKQDAEADLPADIVAEGGAGSRASWNGEFFVDWITDADKPTVLVYAQKANNSVDWNFTGNLGIPANIQASYRALLEKSVQDDWHGRMSWSEAARRDGAPPIYIAGMDVNDVLRRLRALPMAQTMSMAAITNIPRLARTLSEQVNDGFFLTQSPAALAAAYFVHPSKAFAAMDKLREVQSASKESSTFTWSLPGEYRFVHVKDSAVLQPVEPGLWFNAQMISFADLGKDAQAWKRDFKVVEDYWVKELGARPHMGKLWGFHTTEINTVEPFGSDFACSIYSDATKQKFEAYRTMQDPDGLFFSGLGVKLLGPCK